jgi:hypothetical protein
MMEACPPLFYQEGQGLRWGLPLSLLTRGVGRRGRLDHFGRVVSPHDWGDASLSTNTTEVTVVAAAASDGLPPTVGGDASLSAATEVVAAVDAEDTAAELITCAAPLRVMAPAPTSPKEDASRSSGIPAKGVTAAATSEGAATPIGVETELVTSAAPRRVVAPAPTAGEDAPRTLRRSSRNAGKVTLLKAERLAKKKNLEGIFFSSFSDSRIISNLGRLAINTNTSGITRLKNLEVDRLVVCANKNNKVNANDLISDDEREERLQEALNHAGGFVNGSLFDAENDHILDLSPVS